MTRAGGRREPPSGFAAGLARALDRAEAVFDLWPRLGVALGFGLFVGLIGLGYAEFDYLGTRGVPREQAVVVASGLGTEDISCGKYTTREYLNTYRVTELRPGFPDEFVASECDRATVGDRETIARKDATDRPDVAIAPLNNQLEALGVGGAFGGVAALGSLMWQGIRDGAGRAYERRRPKPPVGEGGYYPSRASPTMRAYRQHERTAAPRGLASRLATADDVVRSVTGRWIVAGRPKLTDGQRDLLRNAVETLDTAGPDLGAEETAYVRQSRTLAASVLDADQVVDDWPL